MNNIFRNPFHRQEKPSQVEKQETDVKQTQQKPEADDAAKGLRPVSPTVSDGTGSPGLGTRSLKPISSSEEGRSGASSPAGGGEEIHKGPTGGMLAGVKAFVKSHIPAEGVQYPAGNLKAMLYNPEVKQAYEELYLKANPENLEQMETLLAWCERKFDVTEEKQIKPEVKQAYEELYLKAKPENLEQMETLLAWCESTLDVTKAIPSIDDTLRSLQMSDNLELRTKMEGMKTAQLEKQLVAAVPDTAKGPENTASQMSAISPQVFQMYGWQQAKGESQSGEIPGFGPFNAEHLKHLTPDQISVLTKEQMQAIPAESIAAWSPQQLAGISKEGFLGLTEEQIGSIQGHEKFEALIDRGVKITQEVGEYDRDPKDCLAQLSRILFESTYSGVDLTTLLPEPQVLFRSCIGDKAKEYRKQGVKDLGRNQMDLKGHGISTSYNAVYDKERKERPGESADITKEGAVEKFLSQMKTVLTPSLQKATSVQLVDAKQGVDNEPPDFCHLVRSENFRQLAFVKI